MRAPFRPPRLLRPVALPSASHRPAPWRPGRQRLASLIAAIDGWRSAARMGRRSPEDLARRHDRLWTALVAHLTRYASEVRTARSGPVHGVAPIALEFDAWPVQNVVDWKASFDRSNTLGVTREQAERVADRYEPPGEDATGGLEQRPADDGGVTRGPTTGATMSGWPVGAEAGWSSGTGGRANRGLFLTAPAERARWAGAVARTYLPRPFPPGGHRVMLFLRAGNPLYERARLPGLAFQHVDLSTSPEAALDALLRFRPTVLMAPPRWLSVWAEREVLPSSLQQTIAVSDVVHPDDRARLQRTGRALSEIYQATEGWLAHGCGHGGLHVREDDLLVEYEPLDATGTLVRPIVTDLFRWAQPMVRVRLDDVWRMAPAGERCACGRTSRRIVRVVGRLHQAWRLPQDAQGHDRWVWPDTVDSWFDPVLLDERLGPQVRDLRCTLDSTGESGQAQVVVQWCPTATAPQGGAIDPVVIGSRLLEQARAGIAEAWGAGEDRPTVMERPWNEAPWSHKRLRVRQQG